MEPPRRPTDAEIARELARQFAHPEAEPMLPAEWWLVGGSLALGLLLLGLLLWASRAWFPVV